MRASKNGLRFLQPSTKSLALGGVLLGALVGCQVNAKTVEDTAFQRFVMSATGVGVQTVKAGSDGTPVVSTASVLRTAPNEGISLERTSAFKNPSGDQVPIKVTSKIPTASIAKLVKVGFSALPLIGAGVAIYDLVKDELGFGVTKKPDGTYEFDKTTTNINYRWWPSNSSACSPQNYPNGWETPQKALDCLQNNVTKTYRNCTALVPGPGVTGTCEMWAGFWMTGLAYTSLRAPDTYSTQVKTLDELADEIASKSGWPTTSKVVDAIADAAPLSPEPVQLDDPVVSGDEPVVTGPASSPVSSKTTTKPDGKVEQVNTTHNYIYQGPNITTTTTTVTNVYNPTTNTTETTTTEATPEPTPEPQQTDCEKNPSAIGCQELNDVPTDEVPTRTENITYASEDLGLGSGSCPAPQSVDTFLGPVELNLGAYCDALETYAKPVLILLATLTALFIVAPVRTDA